MNYSKSWTAPGQGFVTEAKANIYLMDLSSKHYKALMKELPKVAMKLGRSARVGKDTADSIFIGPVDDAGKAKKEVLTVLNKLGIRRPSDVDMRIM